MVIEELLKHNCSTLFIIKPVVGVDIKVLSEFGVVESYLEDVGREDLQGQDLLFILFKPEDFNYFELFLHQQTEDSESFLEDYDYAGGYIVMVYRIPLILKEDFEKFKEGKYSKLSLKFKECYPKTFKINLNSLPTFQWQVFRRDLNLKRDIEKYLGIDFSEIYPNQNEIELWEKPGEKEILDITKISKNYGTITTTEGNSVAE